MKINYEDIITKANARKEALQAVQAFSTAADTHARNILEGLQYFIELAARVNALDDEGKKLLNGAALRATLVGQNAMKMHRDLTCNDGWGSDTAKIMALVGALQ